MSEDSSYRAKRNFFKSQYVTSYFYKDKKILYAYTYLSNITIPPSTSVGIVDVEENGEMTFWEVAMDSQTTIPYVTMYGDDESQYVCNDNSPNDLVTLGRGMCPGDVKLVGSVSPDTSAKAAIWNVPYIARYKADTTADAIGKTTPTFVMRFYGQLPVPYRRFTMNIQNTSSTVTTNVLRIYVIRTIYEQIPTEQTKQENITRKRRETEDIADIEPRGMQEIIPQGYTPYTPLER
jgi:hypothetical protein